jgi:4-amino-4-deoxy-L-arabinose transferase-like glycosyltransferase
MTRRALARGFYALVALFIAGVQLARIDHLLHRWWCADELEHLHAAWCITQGQVPYRDFFEHHTPALYYLLAPPLALFHPEQSAARALAAIVAARFVMWLLCGLLLFLIYRLARQTHSRLAGAVAPLFALSSMMFLDRTLEIRPDLISVPAMLAALLLAVAAFRQSHSGLRTRHSGLAASGALWALAFLATPKIVYALLGFCPAVLILLADPRRRDSPRRRLTMAAALAAGFFVPLLVVLALFAAAHAAGPLAHFALFLNARWKFHLDPWQTLGELAYEAPILASCALAGLAASLATCLTRRAAARALLLPAATFTATLAGIFLIPVPYTEYFLMPIALGSIYAAIALLHLSSLLMRPALRNLPAPLLAAALSTLLLAHYRPPFIHSLLEASALVALLLLAALLLRFRLRHLALIPLLAALALYPFRRTPLVAGPSNADQVAALTFIQNTTPPTAPIFDGWQHIAAPFRPHAWFYFFLHREIRPMLTDADYAQLLADLQSNKIHPTLLILDEDNRALPTPIVTHLETHYPTIPLPSAPYIRTP